MNPNVFRNRAVSLRAKPRKVVEFGLRQVDLEIHRDLFDSHRSSDQYGKDKVTELLDRVAKLMATERNMLIRRSF